MKREPAHLIINSKKAIIFDLFHTLVSLRSAWKEPPPMIHEILGVSRQAWSRQLEMNLHDLYLGAKKDPLVAVGDMARAIDPAISDRTIKTAADCIVDTFAGALIRVPAETIAVLARLKAKGKRLGLVSNASVMEVSAWARSPMASLFDSVVFSCFVGSVKPDRGIYEICMAELSVRPGQTAFVGDGGSDELEGARNLGITPIMVVGLIRDVWPDKIEERRRQADAVIEDLRELIDSGNTCAPISHPRQ